MSMFVIDVKCDFPIFSSMTHFVYVPPLPTRVGNGRPLMMTSLIVIMSLIN